MNATLWFDVVNRFAYETANHSQREITARFAVYDERFSSQKIVVVGD